MSSGEERRLLELDEAIEAVDAAIEYKNEVICGRTKELRSHALLLNQVSLELVRLGQRIRCGYAYYLTDVW